jgi:two-component system sensor kinase FixL
MQEQQTQISRLDRLSVLGEMMSGVAHEINQPLAAISTYAQAGLRFLDPQNPKPDRLKEVLAKLSEQSHRAGGIVERIRELARQQVSTSELVNANDLLRVVEELAVADARARGARIRLELQEGIPPISCDSIQIQQVVLNLIRNAVDAVDSSEYQHGNEIVLQTSITDDDAIRVAVTDCGTGVSSEASESLFQPFSTGKHAGLGLGLSISRSIVTAHGGQLDYYNNPQAGATFFLTLPPASGDIEHES